MLCVCALSGLGVEVSLAVAVPPQCLPKVGFCNKIVAEADGTNQVEFERYQRVHRKIHECITEVGCSRSARVCARACVRACVRVRVHVHVHVHAFQRCIADASIWVAIFAAGGRGEPQLQGVHGSQQRVYVPSGALCGRRRG